LLLLFQEYSDDELLVGQEVIAFLASQPWSTGKVGLVGKSWSAFNALMLAYLNTPHLAAIYIGIQNKQTDKQKTIFLLFFFFKLTEALICISTMCIIWTERKYS
jgi:hypothetical protein